jgi:predicted O-linked N-acetylglucosamine transferase (SPINDLY family)
MIYTEQVRWRMQHADPLKKFIQPNLNDRNPDPRLRIGYVSPDFRNHPIGRFIAPLLACRDRRAFEAVCYCQATASDELTAKLQSHADLWRSISEQSD